VTATPYPPDGRNRRDRRRRSDVTFFGPLLLFLVALVVLAGTLPASGVQIPGARRAQALLNRIPQPWKAPRPTHVLPPDTAAGIVPAAAEAPPEARQSNVAQAAPQRIAVNAESAPSANTTLSPRTEPAPSEAPADLAAEIPAAAVAALPASAKLEGFRHQWQTWNNCGPATITMAASHFGRTETQAQAATFLKPNVNDKNVGPDEMVAYARSLGLRADSLIGGDLERLKRLLSNGVPVIVEVWFTPEPNDGMGHYRLLVGYDDAAQQFIGYDSYQAPGVNVRLAYGPLEEDWRVFNRTYIPVYPAEKAEVVAAILGLDRDEQQMRQRSLAKAQAEVAARPNDPFAWFNLGTNLTLLGRTAEAVPAFDRARALKLPWRMLWYQFELFDAYLAEGRYNDVLALTGANLQQANDLEESHYYRGRALEAQGQIAPARAAYQAAVRFNPRFAPAQHALSQLG
jgi:hypothetical protein